MSEPERKLQRVHLNCPVLVNITDNDGVRVAVPALLLDISTGGAKVQMADYSESYMEAVLEWAPVPSLKTFMLPVKRAWTKPKGHYGLEFKSLTRQQELTLQSFVAFHRGEG